jgi:hypothetical protein
MIYECKDCNYSTKINASILQHYTTKKHKSKFSTEEVKSEVEEVKPEIVKPEEVKPEEVKPVENVPKTPNLSPTVTVADNISANERYVTPVGTKVEVAPVNVTPNADVVKKNKKHKKNKN